MLRNPSAACRAICSSIHSALFCKQACQQTAMNPCDSGGIRTRDPQLRRLLLYPTELPNPCASTARKKRAKVLLFFPFRKKNRTFTAFYVLFFTKGHQKVVLSPVCGMLLRYGWRVRHSWRTASWGCSWYRTPRRCRDFHPHWV